MMMGFLLLFCAETVNGDEIAPNAVMSANIMVPELKQPRRRASQVFVIAFSIRSLRIGSDRLDPAAIACGPVEESSIPAR